MKERKEGRKVGKERKNGRIGKQNEKKMKDRENRKKEKKIRKRMKPELIYAEMEFVNWLGNSVPGCSPRRSLLCRL